MKKKPIIVGAIGVAGLIGMTALAWEVLTVTDPYRVEPLTSSPASGGATVGYSVNSSTGTLSIVSSGEVVAVADPGESFRHEVIWLVEKPSSGTDIPLKEFRCELPKFATESQIRPIGTPVPARIQQVANRNRW